MSLYKGAPVIDTHFNTQRFRALYVQKYVKAKFNRDIKAVDICRFCRLAGLSPVVVQNGLDFLLNQDVDDNDVDDNAVGGDER